MSIRSDSTSSTRHDVPGRDASRGDGGGLIFQGLTSSVEVRPPTRGRESQRERDRSRRRSRDDRPDRDRRRKANRGASPVSVPSRDPLDGADILASEARPASAGVRAPASASVVLSPAAGPHRWRSLTGRRKFTEEGAGSPALYPAHLSTYPHLSR